MAEYCLWAWKAQNIVSGIIQRRILFLPVEFAEEDLQNIVSVTDLGAIKT